MSELEIDNDEITRIPLRSDQHTVSIDSHGKDFVIIITPVRMSERLSELANPVRDPRNSMELEDYG